MLTSDPLYWKPLIPRITIANIANNTVYYQFNPWTDSGTTNKPISLSINLSENTHGTFTLQIEDEGGTLNRDLITKNARVIVEVGKQSSQMTKVLSGLVRATGDSRGANKKRLYNLFGSSTGIRTNERIIYMQKEAIKLDADDVTLDITDPSMKADQLLLNMFQSTFSGSPDIGSGSEESTDIIKLTNFVSNSDVENVIPQLTLEYGEIADGITLLEEMSNAEFHVQTDDTARFRYEIRNPQGGNGFTIKNNREPLIDDADDTCYLIRKSWNYDESIYKSDGYANRLFSILAPSDNIPTDLAGLGYRTGRGGYDNSNTDNITSPTLNEWGVKFRPTHHRFYSGDFMFGISGTGLWIDDPPPYTIPTFRIIKDSGGLPLNSGGTVATLKMDKDFFSRGISEVKLATEYDITLQGASADYVTLDTTTWYWMVLTDDGINNGTNAPTTNEYIWVSWIYNNKNRSADIVKRSTATGGTGTSDSNGGSGWSFWANTTRPLFEMPRTRSLAFMAHDPKAIKALGASGLSGGTNIEAALPSPPSTVRSRESMFRYLVNQLYYMARPRANFAMATVTAPNVPIFPGDPIVISDEILGFSRGTNQYVITRCGDMSYSWGVFDGQGLSYDAPTKISINPVTTVTRYR